MLPVVVHIVHQNGAENLDDARVLAALFGRTAKQWREENLTLAAKNMNIRDAASLHELTVLSNLESYNSILLRNGVSKEMRLQELHRTARQQLQVFEEMNQFALEKLKSPRLLP